MLSFNTAEEKARDWNISTRHVQYLCRMGKVEGAVKRVGAWFIPEDTPVPAKNTKSNTGDFKFVGTKSKVFNTAIEMFVIKGFANVSLKDISNSVGIRQTTMYSHFKTKQDLLDSIYDFYCKYFVSERPDMRDMEDIIQKESLADIIGYIRSEFKGHYHKRMTDITKIVLQRLGEDDRATEIAKSLMVDEGTRYIEDLLNYAVETGRLAPFDTHLMAVFINMVRTFTLYYWIIDASDEGRAKILEDEKALCQLALEHVVDLMPPDAI